MKKWGKKLALTMSAMLFLITASSCFPSYDLTGTAVIQAFGIDLADDGTYDITLQVYEQQSPGATTTIDPSVNNAALITANGKTISEALENITNLQSEYPFMGQNRMLVLGESISREGLDDVFSYFEHSRLTRQNVDVITVPGTARELLEVNLRHGMLAAQTIEDTLAISEERGFIYRCYYYMLTKNMYLYDGSGIMPIVKKNEDQENLAGNKEQIDSEDEVENVDQINIDGMAIFQDWKLAAYLNEEQSRGYVFLRDSIDKRLVTVEDKDGNLISSSIYTCSTSLKPEFDGDQVTFVLEINAKASIEESYAKMGSYSSPESYWTEVGKLCNEVITKECEEAFKIIINENQCDVLHLKELIQKYNPSLWEEMEDDYQEEMKNFSFRVDSDLTIDRIGLETEQ